jgi:predicted acylesterase/phospholipase RssA
MSVLKTPHMSVKMAVKASMALPFLYTPTKDGESLLVDGGLIHNLPLTYMNSSDISETWGVLFYNDSLEHTKVESIFDYVSKIFDGLVSYKNSIIVEKYRERIILVDPAKFSGLNFSESKETRSEFIDICRNKTLEFIRQSTKPVRRYSVS